MARSFCCLKPRCHSWKDQGRYREKSQNDLHLNRLVVLFLDPVAGSYDVVIIGCMLSAYHTLQELAKIWGRLTFHPCRMLHELRVVLASLSTPAASLLEWLETAGLLTKFDIDLNDRKHLICHSSFLGSILDSKSTIFLSCQRVFCSPYSTQIATDMGDKEFISRVRTVVFIYKSQKVWIELKTGLAKDSASKFELSPIIESTLLWNRSSIKCLHNNMRDIAS